MPINGPLLTALRRAFSFLFLAIFPWRFLFELASKDQIPRPSSWTNHWPSRSSKSWPPWWRYFEKWFPLPQLVQSESTKRAFLKSFQNFWAFPLGGDFCNYQDNIWGIYAYALMLQCYPFITADVVGKTGRGGALGTSGTLGAIGIFRTGETDSLAFFLANETFNSFALSFNSKLKFILEIE